MRNSGLYRLPRLSDLKVSILQGSVSDDVLTIMEHTLGQVPPSTSVSHPLFHQDS